MMKQPPAVSRLMVSLDIEGETRKLGELAWSRQERRAYFQYAGEFLENALMVSPFHLPIRSGLQEAKHEPFNGLHGLFNDSLPDAWGRMLVDKKLSRLGINFSQLTPLDRLAAVGTTGMGALIYEPAIESEAEELKVADLDWFAQEVEKVIQEVPATDIEALQAAQGGSAGAKPKIVVGLSQDQNTVILDHGGGLPDGFESWLVKFPSKDDPAEIGVEEHAYALMAHDAGIEMSETKVISTEQGNKLFATKRFDRNEQGKVHMHTASGLLYASHAYSSIGYRELLKLTGMMTKNQEAVQAMYKRMVFNVLAKNLDDHTKNHAFLMDKTGKWSVSPAYDLTYSIGPAEHSLSIDGHGRDIKDKHMLAIAKGASLSSAGASHDIEQIRSVINDWPRYAEQAGLSQKRTQELDHQLNGVRGRQPAPSTPSSGPGRG